MKRVMVLVTLWCLMLGATAPTASAEPNMGALMDETQRVAEAADRMGFVWWIPLEFWEVSMAAEPAADQAEIDAFMAALEDYTIIAAADGDIGPIGGVTWMSPMEVRESLLLQDAEGTEYEPFPEDQVNADARNLAAVMKPILVSLIGPMGEAMEFFFFPANNAAGDPIADPTSPGAFSLRLADETYKWRLPLSSLIPAKVCPVDNEELSGAWAYCPWHGKKLEELP